MSKFYENLCLSFIRPTRQIYSLKDLGPPSNGTIRRQDFKVRNRQNKNLQCSYFRKCNGNNPLVCVVYLHSMNGSRLQSLPVTSFTINQLFDSSFCSFDCSGSGISDGEYVSLGYYEHQDLQSILIYLRDSFSLNNFILWGRSMGASTIIKFASSHQNLKCSDIHLKGIIVDSPYCSLTDLAVQIAKSKMKLPQFVLKALLIPIQNRIYQLAHFKISWLELVKECHNIQTPILFVASKQDQVVSYEHSVKLYNQIKSIIFDYQGKNKHIHFIQGDHNDERGNQVLRYIINFANMVHLGAKSQKRGLTTFHEDVKAYTKKDNILQHKIFDKHTPLLLINNQHKSHKILRHHRNLSTSTNIRQSLIVQKQRNVKNYMQSGSVNSIGGELKQKPNIFDEQNQKLKYGDKKFTQTVGIDSSLSINKKKKKVKSPKKQNKVGKLRSDCSLNRTPRLIIQDKQSIEKPRNTQNKCKHFQIKEFQLNQHSPSFRQHQIIDEDQVGESNDLVIPDECNAHYQQKLKKLRAKKQKSMQNVFYSDTKIGPRLVVRQPITNIFRDQQNQAEIYKTIQGYSNSPFFQLIDQTLHDGLKRMKQQEQQERQQVSGNHMNIIGQKLSRNQQRRRNKKDNLIGNSDENKMGIISSSVRKQQQQQQQLLQQQQQQLQLQDGNKLQWKNIGDTKIRSMHVLPHMKFMPVIRRVSNDGRVDITQKNTLASSHRRMQN